MSAAAPIAVSVDGHGTVSALLLAPPDASACYVFAHGAGAGMAHSFMASLAEALAERRIATLRFNFPAMERGSRRPDAPPVAHAAVRAMGEHIARRRIGWREQQRGNGALSVDGHGDRGGSGHWQLVQRALRRPRVGSLDCPLAPLRALR